MLQHSNIVIRPPRIDEASEVYTLLKAYAAYDGSSSALQANKISLKEELFGKHPTLHAIVVLIDQEFVGLMLYYFSFSSWQMKKCVWIEDLFVVEEYRSKGIGKRLLEKARDIALEYDCARVDWHVRRVNHKAQRFYASMGGHIDDETIPVYWNVRAS